MKTHTLVAVLSFVFLVSSCKKDDLTAEEAQETPTTYTLGEEHLGGIVIQLDADAEHGIVVAKTDQVVYADHINYNASKTKVEAYTVGGTGWRLPSKTELQLIYNNRSTYGLTGFASRNYWSSTLGNGTAWSQYFGVPGGISSTPWKQFSNCTLCSRGVKDF